MKFLKWAGIIVLVLVVVVIAAFIFAPPARYDTRVEVNRPVEVAWAVFTDESRTGEWLEGFKSVETLSGEPLTAGSRFRMTFEEDGEEIVMDEEMLTVIPHEEFSFRLTHEMMEAVTKVRFEEANDKTIITSENTVHGKGFFKILAPIMKGAFQSRGQLIYENLKAAIESTPERSMDLELPAGEAADGTLIPGEAASLAGSAGAAASE